MNAIVKTERQSLVAGHSIRAIVPTTMEDAYRIATAAVKAGIAPNGMEKPEACLIAVMHGLEIGLPPMQALQRIAVINGRPSIWGDAAIGLVRASGKAASVKEWIEGEGDQRTAHCEVKRKDDPEPIRGSFSVADAKRAGLWDTRERVRRQKKNGEWYEKENDSPWFRFPDRMLKMRARGFTLRDGFADVLGGLYLREEVEDLEPREMRDVTPPAPPSPPSPPSPDAEPETEAEIVAEGEGFDLGDFLETLETNLAGQDTPEDVEEVWTDSDVEATLESEGHGDMIEAARSIKDRRLQALERDDFPADQPREMHPLEAG